MVSCKACGLGKSKKTIDKGISFHSFPKNEERKKKWLDFIGKENDISLKYKYLCSQHFSPECFDRTSSARISLKKDAVPSIIVHRLKYVHDRVQNYPGNNATLLSDNSTPATTILRFQHTYNFKDNLPVTFTTALSSTTQHSTPCSPLKGHLSTSCVLENDTPRKKRLKQHIKALNEQLILSRQRVRILQKRLVKKKSQIMRLTAIMAILKDMMI